MKHTSNFLIKWSPAAESLGTPTKISRRSWRAGVWEEVQSMGNKMKKLAKSPCSQWGQVIILPKSQWEDRSLNNESLNLLCDVQKRDSSFSASACPLQLFDSQGIVIDLLILPQHKEGEGTFTKESFLHFQSPPVLPQPIKQFCYSLLKSDCILPQSKLHSERWVKSGLLSVSAFKCPLD